MKPIAYTFFLHIVAVSLTVLLSACSAGIELQDKYSTDQGQCWGQIAAYGASNNEQKVQFFNECMKQKGWDMGAPPDANANDQQKKKEMLRPPTRGMFPYREY